MSFPEVLAPILSGVLLVTFGWGILSAWWNDEPVPWDWHYHRKRRP